MLPIYVNLLQSLERPLCYGFGALWIQDYGISSNDLGSALELIAILVE